MSALVLVQGRVPEHVRDKLEAISEREDRSISNLVRLAVSDYVEQYVGDPDGLAEEAKAA